MARLKVTQTRSEIGGKQNQRDTLRSLGLKRIGDVVDGEGAVGGVLRDAGVKQHLQQHVTEFGAEFVDVAAADRVEQLVGLLQQVPPQRVVGLLALPRPRGAQRVHRRDGVDEALARLRAEFERAE